MMFRKILCLLCIVSFQLVSSGMVAAGSLSKAQWVEISDDKNQFDKNCDYKVWVIEDKKWRETWYLEGFDSENAFYTINRQSSLWTDKAAYYALNHKDKRKFLIGDNFIDVVTFALCLPIK